MHSIGIVVPFYNTYSALEKLLATLKDVEFPIKFISMNALDGSNELVQKEFPDAELYTFDKDKHISSALNEIITGFDVGVAVIIQPGVYEISRETLMDLATCEEFDPDGKRIATAAPMLVNHTGLVPHTGVVMMRAEPRFADPLKPQDHPRVCAVRKFLMLSGECLAIDKSVFTELGGFREELAHTQWDLEYTFRASKAGFSNVYYPPARVGYDRVRYTHDSLEQDKIDFFTAHGDIEGMNGYNDANDYYQSQNGNWPAVEHWRHKAFESYKAKICALVADHEGSGYYRIKNPLYGLALRGYELLLTSWLSDYYIEWADVLVIQRAVSDQAREYIEKFRATGKPVIYEVDDFAHGFTDYNPVQRVYAANPNWLRNIEKMIYQCQALVVSSPELARKYSRFNPNTHVIENAIDFGAVQEHVQENTDGTVRIGWAGSDSHELDLREIIPALEQVLNERENAVLVFIGYDARHLLPNVPLNRMQWLPGSFGHENPVEDYYAVLGAAKLDIGLAPLVDNDFNRCKSDLKLIEYGAYGIVPVASDVEPYRRLLEKRRGNNGVRLGFLARSERDWRKYLLRLIDDPTLRYNMGLALLMNVQQNRHVGRMIDRYEFVLDAVLAGKGHQPRAEEPVHSLNVPYLRNATAKQATQLYTRQREEQARMIAEMLKREQAGEEPYQSAAQAEE